LENSIFAPGILLDFSSNSAIISTTDCFLSFQLKINQTSTCIRTCTFSQNFIAKEETDFTPSTPSLAFVILLKYHSFFLMKMGVLIAKHSLILIWDKSRRDSTLINHVPAQNTTSAIKVIALLFIIFPSRF
jgi:hypothetical protein